MWCWGWNQNGMIGDGTKTTRPLPTKVPALQGAVEAAGGETHTCALLANGTAKCWGDNAAGDVGDGTLTVNRLSPVAVVA